MQTSPFLTLECPALASSALLGGFSDTLGSMATVAIMLRINHRRPSHIAVGIFLQPGVNSSRGLPTFGRRFSRARQELAPPAAAETVELITKAILVLRRHPYMGRVIDGGLHELVISRGHTGHVALYRVKRIEDAVLILSIRHQREAGFIPER